ncbi:MAG: hypothetical protein JSS83_03350 [Cyanobacteria bacterium SZAS LIN-3]|nr:hypothetical protein [Cyanobacteria bacterium SZAS LIN-3]
MQIRIANRQDEAPVRALLEKQGYTLDLAGADVDLRNLDQGYFGKDGLFVVAEENGDLIAFAGALKAADDENILLLKRLVLSPDLQAGADGTTGSAIKDRFLTVIKNHAYQMDFKTIRVAEGLESMIN